MARTKRVPQITIRMLRERDACYDDTALAKLFGERRFLTPWDICALKIPAADKLWALLHPTAIPIDELNQLVAVFAAPVLQSPVLPASCWPLGSAGWLVKPATRS